MFTFPRLIPLLFVAPMLFVAPKALYGIFFPLPQLSIVDAVSNGLVAVAPGAFVAISSPGRHGVLKDHLADVTTEFKGADGKIAPMTAIEPPRGSPAEVFAAIPANAVIGAGTITVKAPSFNESQSISITAVAPGIFTRNQIGYGPTIASRKDWSQPTLTSSALPDQEIALFATGLGGATTRDVSVEVAGQSGLVLYAGPQGLLGLDQINVILPKNVQLGCYVPIAIRVRGVLSNYASLPISNTPGACLHPLGLSLDDMRTLEAGGTIPMAYSRAGEAQIERNDTAYLWMMRVDASDAFVASGYAVPDSLYYACEAPPRYSGATSAENDDAGLMNLTTPAGQILAMKKTEGGPYGISSESPLLASGTWRISAVGGADVGSFSQTFWIPPQLRDLKGQKLGEDLILTWNSAGFLPSDTVTAGPCRARATDGRLVIPGAASQTDVAAYLRPNSAARTIFSLPRVDGRSMQAIIDYNFYFPISEIR